MSYPKHKHKRFKKFETHVFVHQRLHETDEVLDENILPTRLLDYKRRVKNIIEIIKSGKDSKDSLAVAKQLLGAINVEDKDGELSKEKSQLEAIIQEQEKNKTSVAFTRNPLLSFNKFRNRGK